MCILDKPSLHLTLIWRLRVWTTETGNMRNNEISWDLFILPLFSVSLASPLLLWHHCSPLKCNWLPPSFSFFFLRFPYPSIFACRCMSFKTIEVGSWSFSTGVNGPWWQQWITQTFTAPPVLVCVCVCVCVCGVHQVAVCVPKPPPPPRHHQQRRLLSSLSHLSLCLSVSQWVTAQTEASSSSSVVGWMACR